MQHKRPTRNIINSCVSVFVYMYIHICIYASFVKCSFCVFQSLLVSDVSSYTYVKIVSLFQYIAQDTHTHKHTY